MRSRTLLSLSLLVLLLARLAHASWHYYENYNAVNGCGETCTNATAPFVCLGRFSSATQCEAACSRNPKCNIMSWSSDTGNCWTRTDNVWEALSWAGVVAGCNSDTAVGCGGSSPYSGPITGTPFFPFFLCISSDDREPFSNIDAIHLTSIIIIPITHLTDSFTFSLGGRYRVGPHSSSVPCGHV